MTCNTLCLKLVLQLLVSALPSVAAAGVTSQHHPANDMVQIRDFHILCWNRQTTDSHQGFSRTTGTPCTQTLNWNPHHKHQSQGQVQACAMASWETWDHLTRAWDQWQHICNPNTFHIRSGCSTVNAHLPAFALSLCQAEFNKTNQPTNKNPNSKPNYKNYITV